MCVNEKQKIYLTCNNSTWFQIDTSCSSILSSEFPVVGIVWNVGQGELLWMNPETKRSIFMFFHEWLLSYYSPVLLWMKWSTSALLDQASVISQRQYLNEINILG